MVWKPYVAPWEERDEIHRQHLHCMWTVGNLRWRLDPDQKEIYDQMVEFFSRCRTSHERLWVNEWARRRGKDFLTWIFVRERMRRHKHHIYHYGTAFEKDINLILIPIIEFVEQDCPPEYKLIPRETKGMFVDPVTKSEVRLVGLDKNPNGIRGNRGDGIVVTEYSYCNRIEESETAFIPMLVENPDAWRIYNSTPGESVAHRWHTVIVPRAKKSGGYSLKKLDGCPRFTAEQIEATYDELGGRESSKAKRELDCKHIGEQSAMVIPEAVDAMDEICVDHYDRPFNAAGYVGMDPGMVDFTGVVWAYHDFKHDMLVFEKAWGEPRNNTDEIADVLQRTEKELWTDAHFGYHRDNRYRDNPYKRVCDRELRLISDLAKLYGLRFEAALKHDLQAGINLLRTRVQQRKARILPGARDLAIHMEAAIWNKARTKLEHVSDDLGHFDILMAAIYLNRAVDVNFNPIPKFQTSNEMYHQPHPQKPASSGWTYNRSRTGGILQ